MTRANEKTSLALKGPEIQPAWDWYSATLAPDVEGPDVIDQLGAVLGGSWQTSHGKRGYGQRVDLRHGDRSVVSVHFGGSQERPLVETTGGDAVTLVPIIRQFWPEHRVTRADSAMDWDQEGAWDALSGTVLGLVTEKGIKRRVAGDWLTPGSPEGRTLYAGGRSSMTQVRCYEKGKQEPSAGRPYWTRVELQTRPERAGKAALATMGPEEVWGTAAWARELSERLTGLPVARAQLGGYVRPDRARTEDYLKRQFASFWLMSRDAYGGDWAAWGRAWGEDVEELVRQQLP